MLDAPYPCFLQVICYSLFDFSCWHLFVKPAAQQLAVV